MNNPQPSAATDVASLDLRGEVCPYPVMFTLEQLATMQPGEVLEVILDCPSAFVNVPIEIARHGHRLLAEPDVGEAETIMIIECGSLKQA